MRRIENDHPDLQRRRLIKVGIVVGGAALGGGLVLGCQSKAPGDSAAAEPFSPNAYLRVDPEGITTVILPRSEMGQGVYTSIPILVAEELDIALERVRVEIPRGNPKLFGELFPDFPEHAQDTGGSQSIRQTWEPVRRAAASARAMLIAAAAQTWKVPHSQCTTELGHVVDAASGRKLNYGALVRAAADMPVPQDAPLKDPKNYRLIGRATPRLDTAQKIDGTTVYGIDVKLPGMKVATLAASPVIGGTVRSLDEQAARQVPGVRQVVKLADAVAVVADNYWAAKKGLEALNIEWNEGVNATLEQAHIVADLASAAQKSGGVAGAEGDVGVAMKDAARRIEARYWQPFLAHAPMEPGNCVVHVRGDGCDVWTGTQVPGMARTIAAAAAGVPVSNVEIHNYMLGGAFGRRLETDMIERAIQIGKSVPSPVKVIWSREEDMQHDRYRPAYHDHIQAGLDASGKPVAWLHRIAGSSIVARLYPDFFKEGVDIDAVESSVVTPYTLPNTRVEFNRQESPVTTSWWRGVGVTRSVFVVESFIDELAAATKTDPLEYRRSLLKSERARAVLDLAAQKAGWGTSLGKGWGRGISLLHAWGTFLAQVAEVEIGSDGSVNVRRVVVAVDCGQPVNTAGITAQIEGGVIFGLSAALHGEITIEKGRVKQSNFHDFRVLRINEAPAVETHIIATAHKPGGIGEPPTAGAAAALANAVFAACGKRIRSLPLAKAMRS